MGRFLIAILWLFSSLSWAKSPDTCIYALEIWVANAPMEKVIPALKVGASNGDAECSAFVGLLLLDTENAQKQNYIADPREGYKYLKQAALNSEEIDRDIKVDVFYWLGRAYFDGKPVLQNFKMAYSWFSLGASLDHPRSSAMRDRTFYLLKQAGMADGVQEFALRCKSSPKLCLPE